MRDWLLSFGTPEGAGDPLCLTLAADMRLCKPDYLNDHIWELEIGGGEPASLGIRTTYGLRARNMRLFYRFSEGGNTATNPAAFPRPPRLRRFYPNFLWLDFLPLEGLEVTAEYWIPESHAVAGRLSFINRTPAGRRVDVEFCGALAPLQGQSLAFSQQQMVNVLAGKTGGLSPVLFMTGGPRLGPGPHPSLAITLEFDPGSTRTLTWCLAAEPAAEASFELARQIAARPWDAERARIELVDAGDVLEIHTGDPDWDAALAFSQRQALGLFYPANGGLPSASFVNSRQPDHGFSPAQNGLDYPAGWSGQTPFDAYYASSLLPMALSLRRGLLENFLSAQTEDGAIDGKPGMGGQRARLLAPPLLASLAWNYYQDTQDEVFLQGVFPKLLKFFQAWFRADHDPDDDGIPEWDHILQMGFEDHPAFDLWHPWSPGMPAGALFSPELEALLYREATSLILMAEKLEQTAEIGLLHEHAARLRSSVESSWEVEQCIYCYRDRLSGACSSGQLIGRHKGPGEMRPRRAEFKQPARLLIEVHVADPAAPRPVIEIVGRGTDSGPAAARRQTERIEGNQLQRRDGGMIAISQNAYCKVQQIIIRDLEEGGRVTVRSVGDGSQDITLFTPLWAHTAETERAESLVRSALLDAARFDRSFGIAALASAPEARAEPVAMSVHMSWNHLIGEGLLAYGYRAEAARLTGKLMGAVIQCLKQSHAFYERYHAETGKGMGERGASAGLAPVGLFLQTLGVSILSPRRVRLEGRNPFPWPVTILYRGLKVTRGLEETEVVFANGQTVKVSDPEMCVVSV